MLKSALITLSLNVSCKPLSSLEVIHVLISHSHTDVMITSLFSWVDHVICSSVILNAINNIMSVDSVDNFSDHLPVFFTLNCSALSTHLRHTSISQRSSMIPYPLRSIGAKSLRMTYSIFGISFSTIFPCFPVQLWYNVLKFYEMSSYFHKRTEGLLMKFITCVLINNSYNALFL